jgi:putative endonuclease
MAGRASDARAQPEPPAGFGRWPFWRRWFGQRSERFAARYLRKLGWRVLAANVADREGELDLLALDGGTLVVVEVRSRSVPDPRAAADTVDLAKQRRLTEAAVRFLSRRRLLGTNVRSAVLHVRQAFEATGRFQMFH